MSHGHFPGVFFAVGVRLGQRSSRAFDPFAVLTPSILPDIILRCSQLISEEVFVSLVLAVHHLHVHFIACSAFLRSVLISRGATLEKRWLRERHHGIGRGRQHRNSDTGRRVLLIPWGRLFEGGGDQGALGIIPIPILVSSSGSPSCREGGTESDTVAPGLDVRCMQASLWVEEPRLLRRQVLLVNRLRDHLVHLWIPLPLVEYMKVVEQVLLRLLLINSLLKIL